MYIVYIGAVPFLLCGVLLSAMRSPIVGQYKIPTLFAASLVQKILIGGLSGVAELNNTIVSLSLICWLQLLTKMIKVAVVLATLFIMIAQSAVFDSSKLFLGALYVMNLFSEKKFSERVYCSDTTAFEGHPNQIDLVIAMDESESVGFSNFNIMKTLMKEIISHFVISYSETRVAVVTWSTSVTLEFDFNKHINNNGVKSGIDAVTYNGGMTFAGNALNFIRNYVFSQSSPNSKKLMFIIIDGRPNGRTHNPATEAQLLKSSGVEIFAFGIGGNIFDPELSSLASEPTDKHKFKIRRPLVTYRIIISNLIIGN